MLPRFHALPLVGALLSTSVVMADTGDKDGRWGGLAGASLSLSSGNTDSASVLLNANIARQTEQEKTSVRASVNQARSDTNGERTTTANKWSIAAQQDIDLNAVWFAFGSLGFDADRLIELKLRSTVSGGLGYHVIESDPHNFDVFGGVSYTHKHYRTLQTIHDKTATRFSNMGLLLGEESTHQLNEAVSLKQRLEYYPGLTGDKTQLLKFSGALNVSLTKDLSLSVGLTSTYNSQVPPGVKKTDSTLFTGLNLKLGS